MRQAASPGIVVEPAAQPLDVGVDDFRIGVAASGPDLAQQCRVGHDPPGVERQQPQQLELGGGELDGVPASVTRRRS